MIVSDRWKFLIATPTKTGNHSLRGMTEAWASKGGSEDELRYYRPVVANRSVGFQHQMAVPVGMEDYDRWIVVRDPYARLVSCFEFMRKNRTEWGHWNTVGGFELFCEWFARQRQAIGNRFPEARVISAQSPYKFIEPYVVLHALLAGDIPEAGRRWGQRPAGRIRLHRVGDDLARVEAVAHQRWTDAHPGQPNERPWMFPPMPHRNAARPEDRWPGMTTWRDYWEGSERLAELGELLCGRDRNWLASSISEPGSVLR